MAESPVDSPTGAEAAADQDSDSDQFEDAPQSPSVYRSSLDTLHGGIGVLSTVERLSLSQRLLMHSQLGWCSLSILQRVSTIPKFGKKMV